jgi:RpiR family murPQ operon transcriptional repressor
VNLLTKMREVDGLTPSEQHIVDYIFEKLNEILNIGIVELADCTFTSTATVKRLCKKLGKESYIDFRLELSYELMRYNQNSILKTAQTPVDRYDSLDDIIVKVANQNAKSILDTISTNTTENINAVVTAMAQAKRIDFYGMGPSHVVALDAQIKCMRLGIPSSAFSDRVSMMLNAKAFTDNTLAFMISYTGTTSEILEVARELVRVGSDTVSLTSAKPNQLVELCAYNLYVDSSESWNRLGGMSSRISTLNLIDILFTALINSDYQKFNHSMSKNLVNNVSNANL